MKYAFPFDTYGENEYLVPIDAAIVPIVSGALEKLLTEYVWQSAEDYEAGYNAIAKVMAAMSGNSLSELLRVQKATYRLLDSVFNGAEYTATDGVVTPEIEDVPSGGEESPAALRANVARLWQLGENAATGAPFETSPNGVGVPLDAAGGWSARLASVQGTKDATWFGGGTPVTLADLFTRQGVVGEEDEGIISDAVEEVLGTIQDTTGIGSALASVFGGAVDLASDGGVMATLLASLVAQAASTATLAVGLEATVAELRALNRRLAGSDAQGDPATPSEVPTIRDSVRAVADSSAETVLRLYDNLNRATLGDTVGAMRQDAAQVVANTSAIAQNTDLTRIEAARAADAAERAADCCEDGQSSYPDPAGLACPDYPTHVITVTYDFQGATDPVFGTMVQVSESTSVAINTLGDNDGVQSFVDGPRELCVVLVYDDREAEEARTAAAGFVAVFPVSGALASRPVPEGAGPVPGVSGPYWNVDNVDTSLAICYVSSAGLAPGAPAPQYPVKVYIYAGAVG